MIVRKGGGAGGVSEGLQAAKFQLLIGDFEPREGTMLLLPGIEQVSHRT